MLSLSNCSYVIISLVGGSFSLFSSSELSLVSVLGKRKLSDIVVEKTLIATNKRQRHNQPLNNDAVKVMMRWYETHQESPYPNKAEKEQMAKEGGISVTQNTLQ
jgi:hypothetical protein